MKDNIMVMASEVGVYDTDPANVTLKVRYIFYQCTVLEKLIIVSRIRNS